MTKNGGPAFPCDPDKFWDYTGQPNTEAMGMSLRDWFAGQALAGNMASWEPGTEINITLVVRGAYRIADAMLAEREKSS